MGPYLGDFAEDAIVYFAWDTNKGDGASITRATDGTISVYKDNGTTQSAAGVTDTEDFDSLTGIHMVTVDTSADAFYAKGHDYAVILSAATIDGKTVNAVLATFSIENRFSRVTAARAQVLDDWINDGRLDAILDIIAADVVNIDGAAMRGTDSAALASVCTPGRLAELDAGNMPAALDAVLTDTGTTLPATLAVIAAFLDTEIAAILANTNELQTDDVPGLIAALNNPDAAAIADAVWNEGSAGHTNAGYAGVQLWTTLDSIWQKVAALHDTRLTAGRATKLDNLDATISSRSSHSAADAGTDAASKMLATPANLLATDGSGNVGITQTAADKVWATTTRTITGLTTAAIKSVWDQLTSALTTVGSIGKLIVDYLDAAVSGVSDVTVVLGAIQTTVEPGNRTNSPITLAMFANEGKTFVLSVLDSAGDAVDLSGLTLRFVVQDTQNPPVGQFKVEVPTITVSGTNNEVASVPVSAAQAATPSTEMYWLLWDVDNSTVLLHGSFEIKPAEEDVT